MEKLIKQLETVGYCVLRKQIEPERIERTLQLAKHWYDATQKDLAVSRPALAQDPFLWNPQNKEHYFLDTMFCSERINLLLKHFLNDPWYKQIPQDQPNYILRNLLVRKGEKTLPMHIDSLVPYGGPHVFVMQVAMILEDQDETNGCTFVVPGSHRSVEYADQSGFEIAIPVITKAGDIVIWDSRIWHGAKANDSGKSRWSLIATYSRWWLKQMFNIPGNLPQEIYERLTDSQKAILGFCSTPHETEVHGIDMKRGYNSLPGDVTRYR